MGQERSGPQARYVFCMCCLGCKLNNIQAEHKQGKSLRRNYARYWGQKLDWYSELVKKWDRDRVGEWNGD